MIKKVRAYTKALGGHKHSDGSSTKIEIGSDAPFGTTLEDQCVGLHEDDIPPFLRNFIANLVMYGMKKEGIFRLSGSAASVNALKSEIQSGERKGFTVDDNAYDVACLMKIYFRELNEPLLTFELYDCFIAAQGLPEDIRTQAIAKAIALLPHRNFVVLFRLAEFLGEVARNAADNKMTAHNLAIVFAPNILRPQVESMETIVSDSALANTLVETIIEHREQFFQSHKDKINAQIKLQKEPKQKDDFVSTMRLNYKMHRQASDNAMTLQRRMMEQQGKAEEYDEQLTQRYAKIQLGLGDEEPVPTDARSRFANAHRTWEQQELGDLIKKMREIRRSTIVDPSYLSLYEQDVVQEDQIDEEQVLEEEQLD